MTLCLEFKSDVEKVHYLVVYFRSDAIRIKLVKIVTRVILTLVRIIEVYVYMYETQVTNFKFHMSPGKINCFTVFFKRNKHSRNQTEIYVLS